MSFPSNPTVGQVVQPNAPNGPQYVYRGQARWDVVTAPATFNASNYYTKAQIDEQQATQDGATTAATAAAAAAQTTANAAIPSTQKGANNGVASLNASGYVPDAQNRPDYGQIRNLPSSFTPSTHNHDDRYYTKTLSDARYQTLDTTATTDWNAATDSKLYTGINAINAPASGTFYGCTRALSDTILLQTVIAVDDARKVFTRAQSSGTWSSWVQQTAAGGQVWHGDNMPAAQAAWDDGTPNTLVRRSSQGYVHAPYFKTPSGSVTATPSRIAVETGNDGFIRWQTPAQFISNITPFSNAVTNLRIGTETVTTDAYSQVRKAPLQMQVAGVWTTVGSFVTNVVVYAQSTPGGPQGA